MRKFLTTAAVLAAIVPFTAGMAMADDAIYKVTVTNVTAGRAGDALAAGQVFTPILVAVHKAGVRIFTPGAPASYEVGRVAEGGDIAPLAAALAANPDVGDVQDSGGLTPPGHSSEILLTAGKKEKRLSLIGMLLPTNDGLVALVDVALPKGKKPVVYHAVAYDGGTETNDESCIHIPGPHCGGEPFSPDDDGEGYVHVHRGIQGSGDLDASTRDWRNPVAIVTITKIDD